MKQLARAADLKKLVDYQAVITIRLVLLLGGRENDIMARKPSMTAAGQPFDTRTIDAVWRKASIVPGVDTSVTRRDACGATIKRAFYGTTAEYGWEIDHTIPLTQGGTDDFSNLQPLHWENNRHKGDDYPDWKCAKTA